MHVSRLKLNPIFALPRILDLYNKTILGALRFPKWANLGRRISRLFKQAENSIDEFSHCQGAKIRTYHYAANKVLLMALATLGGDFFGD